MLKQDERIELLAEFAHERQARATILTEWVDYLMRDADSAFLAGAYLATLITAVAALETYLRGEFAGGSAGNFASLIETIEVDEVFRADLQKLRHYRNRWVHVAEPWNDHDLITKPTTHENELEEMAILALRSFGKAVSIP